jgi:uncharacterized DUF497 family protein
VFSSRAETITWRYSTKLNSGEEDRFIAIGPIDRGLVLVIHTECDEETVRLISARWANKRETELYRVHVRGRAP